MAQVAWGEARTLIKRASPSKAANEGELPKFRERKGRIKATGYKVTSLGRPLLRSINQTSMIEKETLTGVVLRSWVVVEERAKPRF